MGMDRTSTAIPATAGVYRTPGREAPDTPFPPPSRRALWSPLGRGLASVLFLAMPPILFNVFVAGPVFGVGGSVRFVPWLETIQDVVAVLLVATLAVVVHRIARRVRPSWGALRLPTKVLYVASLLVVQSALVAGGELALLQSRGGFRLFEPGYRSSSSAPDLRSAHVYEGGFGCDYDVYVAKPFSPIMSRALHISRNQCVLPTPHVKWEKDGSVQLVDRDEKPVEAQSSGSSWGFWGGGC